MHSSLLVRLILLIAMSFSIVITANSRKLNESEKHMILDSINYYRKAIGVPSVKYFREFETLARTRIQTIGAKIKTMRYAEIRNNVNILHYSFRDDANLFNVELNLARKPYGFLSINECVGLFHTDSNMVVDAVQGWMISPTHYKAMMDEYADSMALYSEKQGPYILIVLLIFDDWTKNKRRG